MSSNLKIWVSDLATGRAALSVVSASARTLRKLQSRTLASRIRTQGLRGIPPLFASRCGAFDPLFAGVSGDAAASASRSRNDKPGGSSGFPNPCRHPGKSCD